MMESFHGRSGLTQPVPNVPLTMRSRTSTVTKKISPAAAAELAAAATATVKYDRWKRVPRKMDNLRRYGKRFPKTQRELEKKQMDEDTLQRKVEAAYRALVKMKLRERRQLELSLRIWEEIDSNENDTFKNANMMLRKYERLKTGILRIHKNFQKDFVNEQKEVLNMKQSTESKIKDIEEELSVLDSLLQSQNTEYTELINYKHQKYPQKALIIEGLERDIEDIKEIHEVEEKQVEHVMSSEMAKRQQQWNIEEDGIAKIISEKYFDLMPPAIKQMMIANAVMKKEIKFHLKVKEEVEKQVKSLADEIKQLSQDPLSNYRMQMFPEFFPKETKCNPDLDIVLDIPHQTYIPI